MPCITRLRTAFDIFIDAVPTNYRLNVFANECNPQPFSYRNLIAFLALGIYRCSVHVRVFVVCCMSKNTRCSRFAGVDGVLVFHFISLGKRVRTPMNTP